MAREGIASDNVSLLRSEGGNSESWLLYTFGSSGANALSSVLSLGNEDVTNRYFDCRHETRRVVMRSTCRR